MKGQQQKIDGHPEIPDRLFFRIGEVTEITGVESYVLRFWEQEFPTLSPRKTPKGQRQYRRKDLETILAIKKLLYEEKYTIAGARKALRTGSATGPDSATQQQSAQPQGKPVSREGLAEIRSGLEEILKLLES